MIDFFISPALAAEESGGAGLMDFAFPIVLLVLFYFLSDLWLLLNHGGQKPQNHTEV